MLKTSFARCILACSAMLSALARVAGEVDRMLMAIVQPTVETACKVVFATGQMLAHTAYRFVSKVGGGSAGACYGFVSLLRSLDRTTLKTV